MPVIDLYIPDCEGESLAECLNRDWNTFDNLDIVVANELLSIILDDKELSKRKYKTNFSHSLAHRNDWCSFKNELKYKNRFIIHKSLKKHFDSLEELFEKNFCLQNLPNELYRARINPNTAPISSSKMGKPPNDLASGGRANPLGISYLYTATTPETAIHEIRPHVNDNVTVAKFSFVCNINNIIDLRHPRKILFQYSPFALDEDDLELRCSYLEYLDIIGEELSKPILPREAQLEYLPTQYLCEFIKHHKFSGIAYKSSIDQSTNSGFNIVFFDDSNLKIDNTTQYIVNSTQVKIKQIG